MFELRAELVPVDGHDHLVDATPGPDDSMITLWASREGAALLSTWPAYGADTAPEPGAAPAVGATVVIYGPEPVAAIPLAELRSAFPRVQVFPDGEVLVVGSRCRWWETGPEHNAALFGPDGAPIRTGVLGDGIQHVAVSASGDIWVGYFDEGVFGNFGWGQPGPPPIGAPGLVRFDRSLEPAWRLADRSMADCYALNIAGDTAWACYYTDFPVLRVRGGKTTRWDNPEVGGAQAMAVAGGRVAFHTGYGRNHRARLELGVLDDDRFRLREVVQVALPGKPMPFVTAVHGRGDTLHMVVDREWYTARPLG